MEKTLKLVAKRAKVGEDLIVLRVLPALGMHSVGPFVFLDHFGPVAHFRGGPSAHPHAGIEVITWLFEGANEHRDSLGNRGQVHSGGAQWMKAGRGIIHAETMLPDAAVTHGLQLWVRQPLAQQNDAPVYAAFQSEQIPDWQEGEARLRLLIGRMRTHEGPLVLGLVGLALRVSLPAGASVRLPLNSAHLFALYGITGMVSVSDETVSRAEMLCLPAGTDSVIISNSSESDADCLLFGGEDAPKPLVFGGPFVFETQANIDKAYRDFQEGKMGRLEGVPF